MALSVAIFKPFVELLPMKNLSDSSLKAVHWTFWKGIDVGWAGKREDEEDA